MEKRRYKMEISEEYWNDDEKLQFYSIELIGGLVHKEYMD